MNVRNCIVINNGTTARFVKKLRKDAKLPAIYVAGSALGTSYCAATKELTGTASFSALFGFYVNELTNSLAKLADAKHIKTSSGICYKDVLQRAKRIYNK